jgi:hypothetical protein
MSKRGNKNKAAAAPAFEEDLEEEREPLQLELELGSGRGVEGRDMDEELKAAVAQGYGDSPRARMHAVPVMHPSSFSPLRDLGHITKWDGRAESLHDWLSLLDHTRRSIGMSVDDIVAYMPMLTSDAGRSIVMGYSALHPQGPHSWNQLKQYLIGVMGPTLDHQHWRTLKQAASESVGVLHGKFLQALQYADRHVSDADRLYTFTRALLPKIRAHVSAVEPATMDELLREAQKAERRLYHEQKVAQEAQAEANASAMLSTAVRANTAAGYSSSMANNMNNDNQRRCFACGGYGHLARQCASQRPQEEPRRMFSPAHRRGRGQGRGRGRGRSQAPHRDYRYPEDFPQGQQQQQQPRLQGCVFLSSRRKRKMRWKRTSRSSCSRLAHLMLLNSCLFC